jgi:transcriptional regulator with XRE-family HTH domain
MTPGEQVKHLRIERGLSLQKACALTGGQLVHSTWSRIENGISEEPHPSHKAAIAEALGVKVSDIWQRPAHSLAHVKLTLAGVKEGAEYIERHGTPEEERMYGVRYGAMLELVGPNVRDPDSDDGSFDEHWRLVNSLLFDPEKTPIVIVDPDGNVHRESDHLTPTTQRRVTSAKRARIQARGARAKAHAAAAPTVTTRSRPRERRDSTRRTSGSSPPGDPDSDEPAEGRRTNGAGRVR